MSPHQVRTPEQALVYITDCTLATVSHMAMLKSKKKYEYERQIGIAQKGVDWAISMGIDCSDSRIIDVMKCGGSVEDWACKFLPKNFVL